MAAGALLVGLWPIAAGAATPADGRRAYDAGRFTDAMGIWAQLSHEGSAEAQLGLGLLYDLGNGTPENPEIAFVWYKMAAEAGLPAAEFNVAAMYDGGRGVPRNHESAALWYARAGARGHHRAQFDLGLLYEQGEGVPQNRDAAAAWFRAAADGGVTAARDRLQALKAVPRGGGGTPPSAQLIGATLAWPDRDATLTLTNDNRMVELVWVATRQPQPVHYEVQVHEVDGPVQRESFAASVAVTAAAVRLPTDDAFYIWKVDVVAQDGSRSTGDWSWFSVGSGAPAEQSISSASGVPHASR